MGKALLEHEAVTVGVAGQLGKLGLDRCQRLRAGPQRVLIAGQLDDSGGVQLQLARQLIDRLAWYVRRQLLHARLRQGKEITTHWLGLRLQAQAAGTSLSPATCS